MLAKRPGLRPVEKEPVKHERLLVLGPGLQF
jgi:hypothetical protein